MTNSLTGGLESIPILTANFTLLTTKKLSYKGKSESLEQYLSSNLICCVHYQYKLGKLTPLIKFPHL